MTGSRITGIDSVQVWQYNLAIFESSFSRAIYVDFIHTIAYRQIVQDFYLTVYSGSALQRKCFRALCETEWPCYWRRLPNAHAEVTFSRTRWERIAVDAALSTAVKCDCYVYIREYTMLFVANVRCSSISQFLQEYSHCCPYAILALL